MSNKVSPTAYNARGTENYMCSRHDDTGYVRDREKLFSSDVIILSRAINLVFSLSFYNARLASKSYFPVLIQTHLVGTFSILLSIILSLNEKSLGHETFMTGLTFPSCGIAISEFTRNRSKGGESNGPHTKPFFIQ